MRIAFVCEENTGRSQMAAAFARNMAREEVTVLSGGTKPAPRVSFVVLQAMKEVGIDISREVPRQIGLNELADCDHVVTMDFAPGNLTLPAFAGGLRSWKTVDPKWKPLADVRSIRDEIRIRVQTFLREIGVIQGT